MKKKSIIIVSSIIVLIFIFLSTTQLALIPVDDLSGRVSIMPIPPEIDSELVELSFIDNIYNNIDVLIDWIKSIYSQLLQIVVINDINDTAIIDDIGGEAFSDGVRTDGDEY